MKGMEKEGKSEQWDPCGQTEKSWMNTSEGITSCVLFCFFIFLFFFLIMPEILFFIYINLFILIGG